MTCIDLRDFYDLISEILKLRFPVEINQNYAKASEKEETSEVSSIEEEHNSFKGQESGQCPTSYATI